MNYPDNVTVSTTGKSIRLSPIVRALVLGLALALPATTALAIGEPIPGIDIVVKCLGCTPPFHGIPVPTGADGSYQFKGLAPGKYELSIAGRRVQTITIGDKGSISGDGNNYSSGSNQAAWGSISGVLSREPGGKASITFNGKVGVVPDLPGAPISTTRSNIKRPGISAENEPPRDVLPGEANTAMGDVSTTRGTAPRRDGGNVKSGISNQGLAVDPVPGDLNGDGRRVANTVNPVNDAPGIAGEPVKGGAPSPIVVPGTLAIDGEANSALVGVSTTRGTAPPPPKGGDKTPPGIAGDPVPGTSVGLDHDPGGERVSTITGQDGIYQFTKLQAGKYKLTVPGLPPQSVTVGDDGIAGGKVMRGSDGSLSIFDRWGNIVASSPKNDGIKAAGTPFGFGSGNTPGFGPGTGAGPGMGPGMVPGAGPAIGGPMGGGPAGPGAGAMRR